MVTTIAPMKRGLKVVADDYTFTFDPSYNHCPDEKGTESIRDADNQIPPQWLQPLPR